MDLIKVFEEIKESWTQLNKKKTRNILEVINPVLDHLHPQVLFENLQTLETMKQTFATREMLTLLTLVLNMHKNSPTWPNVSKKVLMESAEELASGNQILFQISDIDKLISSVNKPLPAQSQPIASGSSIIPKGKKRKTTDISMYTTPVPSRATPVDVPSSEDSESSDEGLDAILSSIVSTPKTTGVTGSNIILRNPEGSYFLKSETWTMAEMFIDFKIYENPAVLKTKKPMEWWKEAAFSAKTLLITKNTSEKRAEKIRKVISDLKELCLQEAKTLKAVTTHRPN